MAAFYSDKAKAAADKAADNDPRRFEKASPEQRALMRVIMSSHGNVREIRSVVGEVLLYSSKTRRFSDTFVVQPTSSTLPPSPTPSFEEEVFVSSISGVLEIVDKNTVASNVSKTFDKTFDNDFKIVKTVSQGDCLFDSISIALSRYYSIIDLRIMWANSLTSEDFDLFMDTNQPDMFKGFTQINPIDQAANDIVGPDFDLVQFRNLTMTSGYYGNDVALNYLSKALHVLFIVRHGTINNFTLHNYSYNCDDADLRYIILQHDGGHYRLIEFANRRIFDLKAINDIFKMFGGPVVLNNDQVTPLFVK